MCFHFHTRYHVHLTYSFLYLHFRFFHNLRGQDSRFQLRLSFRIRLLILLDRSHLPALLNWCGLRSMYLKFVSSNPGCGTCLLWQFFGWKYRFCGHLSSKAYHSCGEINSYIMRQMLVQVPNPGKFIKLTPQQ